MPLNKEFVQKQLNKAAEMLEIAHEDDDLEFLMASEIYCYYWRGIEATGGRLVPSSLAQPVCTKAAELKVRLYAMWTGKL